MTALPSIVTLLLFMNFNFANANNEDIGITLDGFIVDEKTDSITSLRKKIENLNSKKAGVLTHSSDHASLKPASRGMALSFQPHEKHIEIVQGTSLGYKPKTENAIKRLHIAPTINLVQTLKTLDGIGKSHWKTGSKKSEDVHPNNQTKLSKVDVADVKLVRSSNTLNNQTDASYKKSKNFTNEIPRLNSTSSNTTSKKDAQPNVITDSQIKGFLGKDVNFTFNNVGEQLKDKSKDKKSGENKIQNIERQNSSLIGKTYIFNSSSIKSSNDEASSPIFNSSSVKSSNDKASSPIYPAPIEIISSNNKSIVQTANKNISNSEEPMFKTVSTNRNTSKVNETINELAILRTKQDKENTSNATKMLNNITTQKFKKHSPQLHVVDIADYALLKAKNSSYFKKSTQALKKDSIVHEECNDKKKCPKNKYCRHYTCYDCHRKHHECVEDDQCCDGILCVYGRCDAKPKGSPGTICEKDGDCGDGCCIIEPTIDEEHGICKNKLAEFHQCSPVLFRKVWVGDDKPKCGPCAGGLECVEEGVIASHLVCMKSKA